jgi:hypothetical protein
LPMVPFLKGEMDSYAGRLNMIGLHDFRFAFQV